MITINARTSPAVTYPNNASDLTLIFDVNICQLPVNHTFHILLDAGESFTIILLRGQYCIQLNCVCVHACVCMCVCVWLISW